MFLQGKQLWLPFLSGLSITSDIYVHLTENAENEVINKMEIAQNDLLNNLV